MILLTSANGKTGRHMMKAMVAKGLPLRAICRSSAGPLGAQEVLYGDQLDKAFLGRAMEGVKAVIHIGPPMHPHESAMGQFVIDAARENGIEHFVYISVLHPQIEALLNHQAKLRVENALIQSRLPFTILQPTHYMQNIDVASVVASGVLTSPFALSSRLSFVDMEDVAEVAAKVVLQPDHWFATYPLCSEDCLTTHEVAEAISTHSGRPIEARYISLEQILDTPGTEGSVGDQTLDKLRRHRGEVPDYSIDALRRLVACYNSYGIRGNPNVLRWLLNRDPTNITAFIRRHLPPFRSEDGQQ
ncbi:SDR family oxidoreductase [Holophaga foetida]|uniref:SDR family oxidoreductase n=1 Tax=Holophaga foetida TaxID=35839 RepID=UPI00024746B9|nr:NmrA family NAD(P)-binding protein [Holophaga foetida]